MTSELADLALRVAALAGTLLMDRRGDAGTVSYKTSETDPVSEADRASEALITEALLAARPDDGMLGEEGASRRGSTGLRWVVDPLDGTVNFLYGIPAWCVSIACEDEHGALVGVVHQPAAGLTYTAVRGKGAFRNGEPLRVNDPVPLEHALIATGFSYDVEDRRRQASALTTLLPAVRDIRRIGSCALDLCMVGAGQVDGYFEDTTSRWDWLAGSLVVTEAGGVARELGNGLVAAGPALFDELLAAIG